MERSLSTVPQCGDAVIIDAHTHAFSPGVVTSRAAMCGREAWFGQLYQTPRSLLTGAADLLTSMELAGISHSIICGFPWKDPGLCRDQNTFFAEAARDSGGRLSWLAAVSPLASGAAADAVAAFEVGAVGVGELNADAQGFDLLRPEHLAAIAEVCVVHDKPLMLHASEPVGHVYPGKGTATPERLLACATAHPHLKLVAAHWGGGLPFYELMPEVSAATRNVVYDSAASTYLYRFDVFRTVLDLAGAGRVMFASDFPILRQDRFLRRVEAQHMTDEERAAVMWKTAASVYGIPEQRTADVVSAREP